MRTKKLFLFLILLKIIKNNISNLILSESEKKDPEISLKNKYTELTLKLTNSGFSIYKNKKKIIIISKNQITIQNRYLNIKNSQLEKGISSIEDGTFEKYKNYEKKGFEKNVFCIKKKIFGGPCKEKENFLLIKNEKKNIKKIKIKFNLIIFGNWSGDNLKIFQLIKKEDEIKEKILFSKYFNNYNSSKIKCLESFINSQEFISIELNENIYQKPIIIFFESNNPNDTCESSFGISNIDILVNYK